MGSGEHLVELEAVLDNIPDGVYVGDLSGVRYANRPALDMLGYDSIEEVNRNIATLMDEVGARDSTGRLLPVEENVFVRALHGASACMDVHVRHRRTGEERILRSSAAPLYVGGAIVGAVALNVDVTEQRRLEREVRTQRALAVLERDVLSQLCDRVPLERVMRTLAEGLEAIAGSGLLASVLVICDGRIRHVAAPSLPAAWCAAIDGAAIGERAGSCGTAAFRRERVVVADIATDPLWDDYRSEAMKHGLRACWSQPIAATDGAVLGTVALYYREPRHPSDHDLAVIEGTARCARIALERHRGDTAREQVLVELRETLQRNEILTGILGHDLRTPLSAVITGTQLVVAQETEPRKRNALARVEASAHRMSRMINQLLDLTRVRAGSGIPVRRRPVDLADVARAVAAEVQTVFPQRNLALEIHGDLRGEWDADRLCQMFTNLLGNAMEHGADGNVILRVVGQDDRNARVEVANAGLIPEGTLASLFDPFKRGSNETTRAQGPQGGLGLGLYITKQIVLAHGGSIAVRSLPSEGTTFEVKLPRA